MDEDSLQFPPKSTLQITSQPTIFALQSNLAMTLSSLSLEKDYIASPPPSTSSMNNIFIKNRKRKRKDWSDWSDWIRVPLEDITHLFHPSNNNEVTPYAATLHLDSPIEKRVEMVKRRVFKPAKMSNRVCLRKEFR